MFKDVIDHSHLPLDCEQLQKGNHGPRTCRLRRYFQRKDPGICTSSSFPTVLRPTSFSLAFSIFQPRLLLRPSPTVPRRNSCIPQVVPTGRR